ncbi:hypothetical protein ACNQGP_10020 [Flavobacterium sp. GT2N3]|uniref:hypothetical protein n=1 Tax=unclassified Flavobacterium TaxID=196869 RepID=UPI003AAC43C3
MKVKPKLESLKLSTKRSMSVISSSFTILNFAPNSQIRQELCKKPWVVFAIRSFGSPKIGGGISGDIHP